jgi:hypothetical protein
MKDAAASHLSGIVTADWCVLVRVTVQSTRVAMVYEDGNGQEHARQDIPYTDLPLTEQTLYAYWDVEHWVIMLPSEY